MMKLLVAGGGTGGHLFPGLSVAKAWKEKFPDAQILFVGSFKAIDKELTEAYGFSFVPLAQPPVPQKLFSLDFLLFPLKTFWSFFKVLGVLSSFQPKVVLGLGGFSSVPTIVVASLLKIPSVLFEPNLYPGKANRFCARFASAVATGFELDAKFFAKLKKVVTGIPVRPTLLNLKREKKEGKTLLLMGGSKGARALNLRLLESFSELKKEIPDLKAIHLTGKEDYDWIQKGYQEQSVADVDVYPFIGEMAPLFAQADLVVSRSGASTLAELTLCGIPSILIPYPYSMEDHQVVNAQFLESQGGAKVILEKDLTLDLFVKEVVGLLKDSTKLVEMSQKSSKLANNKATENLIELLVEVKNG